MANKNVTGVNVGRTVSLYRCERTEHCNVRDLSGVAEVKLQKSVTDLMTDLIISHLSLNASAPQYQSSYAASVILTAKITI